MSITSDYVEYLHCEDLDNFTVRDEGVKIVRLQMSERISATTDLHVICVLSYLIYYVTTNHVPFLHYLSILSVILQPTKQPTTHVRNHISNLSSAKRSSTTLKSNCKLPSSVNTYIANNRTQRKNGHCESPRHT